MSAPIDQTVDTQIYDVDVWENEASVVASLHAQGRHVVCYLDAGTLEDWRPDAKEFPASVQGMEDPGWTGEKWLNISTPEARSIVEGLMEKRMKLCRQKGFDAVDADNVDAWQYSEEGETGFGPPGTITAEDQLIYDKWLASEAHSLGLAIALKSDTNQIAELQPYFDFSVDEECIEYSPDCELLEPFIKAGKPVFEDEYINIKGEKKAKTKRNRANFARTSTRANSWPSRRTRTSMLGTRPAGLRATGLARRAPPVTTSLDSMDPAI